MRNPSVLLASAFSFAGLALCGCAPAVTAQLASPIQIAAGRSPMYGSAADLNGDGKLDLVVARSWGRGEVMVMLGTGDGNFGEPLRIAGNGSPKSPCITDLNGDGKLDLAITDLVEGGTVSVLLGNGNGTFVEPQVHLTGRTASSMKAGDFNGDGKVDLLTVTTKPDSNLMTEELAGKIIFLAGHGDGTFDAPRMMNVWGTPLSVSVGDWDGDGKLDLLVGVPGGQSLFLGEGGGVFRHLKDVYTEASRSGWTADFDKDGFLDVVTARRLLHGDGTGNFSMESLPHRLNNDAVVVAGDFNGDGWLDVVSIDAAHNEIEVFLNTGRGGRKTASR